MPMAPQRGPSREALIPCPHFQTIRSGHNLTTHLECRIASLGSSLRHEKLDFGYRHPIYFLSESRPYLGSSRSTYPRSSVKG